MLNGNLYLKNIKLLLDEYNIFMLVIKAYSKNTIFLYNETVDEFIFFLISKKYYHLNQVNRNTFHNYLAYLKKKSNISNISMNIKIASLNNFTIFLCKTYSLCTLSKLKSLKFLSKKPNILDEKDLLLLIKRTDPDNIDNSSWIDYRDYAMLMLIYSTGVRIGEAIAMEPIDVYEEWIRVDAPKNKLTRYIPINIFMLIAINNYKEVCPYELRNKLWVCSKGKKLHAQTASRAIKRKYGYSAHYFRHCFATHMIHNGCELLVLKEFLGHQSIQTTSIYIHIKPKHLLNTVKKYHPLSVN